MMVKRIEATKMKLGPSEMTFPDHFSDHAHRYEAYRPTYPDALFSYLASLVAAHDLAWDCATGNGQEALGLTPHFRTIIATDATPARSPRLIPTPRSPTSSLPPIGRLSRTARLTW